MLELEHVDVTYHRGTTTEIRAVRDLDLRVPTGQFVTVVGANGSGKSTLVGLLAGTVVPERGVVRIDGDDVTSTADHRRAGRVARVFDDPRAGSAPQLSVADNLALAMARGRRRGLRRAVTTRRRQVMREALAQLGLGLEDRLDQPVGLLSAGQRQSLTMVMATLTRPSLLLLDEHLAALDPTTAATVLSLTRRLVRESGATTVMVTHDMSVALAVGDRLVVMRGGQLIADRRGADRCALSVTGLVELLNGTASAPP